MNRCTISNRWGNCNLQRASAGISHSSRMPLLSLAPRISTGAPRTLSRRNRNRKSTGGNDPREPRRARLPDPWRPGHGSL